jgi:hypothetical protein
MKRFIAFSGGKDSTALALLEKDAQPVFTDTKWEFPDVYQHIEKFEQVTGREVLRLTHPDFPGGLPEYILHSNFLPGHGSRYCTRIFKIEVYNDFIKNYLPAEMLIGLRADEPDRVGNDLTKMKGLTIRYPLREKGLNRIDVLKICVENDLLPRNPLYMARGGCIGCFYKRKAEVRAMINLIPETIDKLQQIEEFVQTERPRDKFIIMFPNCGQSIRAMKNQKELFTAEEVYQSAQQNDDVGLECGLFCNR